MTENKPDNKPDYDYNKELKKRALAIVDIYLDLKRITDREAEILRKAILG